MTVPLVIAIAYLIGSIPTAVWVTRAMGHDITNEGSGNPGTANAMGIAGPRAAATVLVLDATKGAVAVVIGRAVGGDALGLAAALAVVLGQIANVWMRFRGGKGLGVGLGGTLVHWPFGVAVLLPFLALTARATSAARGALITGAATIVLAAVAVAADTPNAWGIDVTWSLVVWAVAVIALVSPKFIRDVMRDRSVATPRG